MQIKLINENFQENSSKFYLNKSLSISSWIIEYFFTEKFFKQNQLLKLKNIIGYYDMFKILKRIQSTITLENFFNFSKNKLKKEKNNNLIEKYNNYLNQCNLIDIIDIIHQCQLELIEETIFLSIKNIQTNFDQLLLEYLIELSIKSSKIYEKIIINEQQINNKNHLKHKLCMYLSLLCNTRNEYALIQCLDFKNEIIVELENLSNNQNLTIYEILFSFVQSKELMLNENLLLRNDLINNNIKEFFDFIKQLQIIIEENEQSIINFRKLLDLILKYLSFNQYDLIINEIIEELCQDFQIGSSFIHSSIIQSASIEAKLSNYRFFQSLIYVCAKQTIDLPIVNIINHEKESIVINRTKSIRKYRSFDLSIIYETNFESDSIENKEIDYQFIPTQSQLIIKRQPLKEIDINSFNNQKHEIENEKNSSQNSVILTLVSDGDKENLPVIRKKRPIISTKNELPNKKHKKITIEDEQKKMISN